IPVSVLRTNPDAYRGAYLWYEGELGYVSPARPGHPVQGYGIHEGWIVTPDAETVLFRVSEPPDRVREWQFVRVEGFFMKLRDSHHMRRCERAPLLVGPEVFPDFAPWEPVTEIDP